MKDRSDKLFAKELKRIHKEHTPPKFDRVLPYNWKKEWGPFVKYQGDWDGAYLLDLIIYKLERMYAGLSIYSNEVKEGLEKRLSKLKETIDLGKKLQTYDYEEEEYSFLKEHTTRYILIYEGENLCTKDSKLLNKVKQLDYNWPDDMMGTKLADEWCKEHGYEEYKNCHYAYTSEWDDDKNYNEWRKLIQKCNKAEQDDTDKFFKLIARNYRGWWW